MEAQVEGVKRNGSVGKYLPGKHVDLSSNPRTHTVKMKLPKIK